MLLKIVINFCGYFFFCRCPSRYGLTLTDLDISNLTVLKLKKTVHFPLIITSHLLILITNFELAACLTFPLDPDTSGN